MTEEKPTLSFKDVHADLEKEAVFVKENHNGKGFQEKGDFLNSIGFTKSIAARLYTSLSGLGSLAQEYEKKYNGLYKFILRPQLERVLERYGLFVRPLGMFMGDIPEKNIQDMMNFKVSADDVWFNNKLSQEMWDEKFINRSISLVSNRFNSFSQLFTLPELSEVLNGNLSNFLEIAAVESLFDPKAFEESRARIIDTPELPPQNKVELDPIVLFKLRAGYLIITAWGDESNDELVANVKLN